MMNSDQNIGRVLVDKPFQKERKPGRPRSISAELEPTVAALYKRGYGYRAIARILREEHGINPDYSSVRQALKRLGLIGRRN